MAYWHIWFPPLQTPPPPQLSDPSQEEGCVLTAELDVVLEEEVFDIVAVCPPSHPSVLLNTQASHYPSSVILHACAKRGGFATALFSFAFVMFPKNCGEGEVRSPNCMAFSPVPFFVGKQEQYIIMFVDETDDLRQQEVYHLSVNIVLFPKVDIMEFSRACFPLGLAFSPLY